jgi:hypothetical protein
MWEDESVMNGVIADFETKNPNIKINYILITIGICFIMFVLGELVKPIYTKLFKDYREVKNEK